MRALRVQLYSNSEYSQIESLDLIFEITNDSKDTIRLLTWNTPLEGFKSDCLDVRRNGKSIPYVGMMVKRGSPEPNDYIIIEPGNSVSKKIDIGEGYCIAISGMIVVGFVNTNLIVNRKRNQQFPEYRFLIRMPDKKKVKKETIKVLTKKANFRFTAFRTTAVKLNRLNIGEKGARTLSTKNKTGFAKGISVASVGPLQCIITGGTMAEKQLVQAAHMNGYQMIIDALLSIADDSKYENWFGFYSTENFNQVKLTFQCIKDEYETKTLTYDLEGGSYCTSGNYGYTYKGSDTIWLCTKFWLAPDTGKNSKAGTIVHERSHASAGTKDKASNEEDCIELALSAPDEAILNADSFEYYAES